MAISLSLPHSLPPSLFASSLLTCPYNVSSLYFSCVYTSNFLQYVTKVRAKSTICLLLLLHHTALRGADTAL